MAKGEKSTFILPYELEEQTASLSQLQKGILFDAIFAYEKRKEISDFGEDGELREAFYCVKGYLDVKRRERKCKCLNGKR